MFKKLNRSQTYLFLILVVLTIFLRFWQIRDYVVFLGDEGRDMMVMRHMILNFRPVFLGPTASVGGFYLGPIYYWMAAPFLALAGFDPIGPSLMVAIFGVATVLLLFKFLKEVAGFYPAILAAFLYSTAPLIVRYSRSSWNPNPLPFFSLALIYSLYCGIKKNKLKYFFIAGACFGIGIQLHYLSIMLIPIAAAIVLINTKIKQVPKYLLFAALGGFLTFSPFLIFEIKHDFPNFRTIIEFITRPTTHGYNNPNLVYVAANFGNMLFEYLSALKGTFITRLVFWFLAIGGIFQLIRSRREQSQKLIFSISVIWFLGGLLLLRFYSGQIFDYYYGFMFPAPFLLFGLLVASFWQNTKFRWATISAVVLTVAYFLANGFYLNPPNKLVNQTESVANFVIDKSEGKPFNFALISDHNSDHAYRYFLEVHGHQPTELETLITDQLLVVCESQKCAPLGHPSWEIAGFGRGEISGAWELPKIGIKVFHLIHWSGAPNPAGRPAVKGG